MKMFNFGKEAKLRVSAVTGLSLCHSYVRQVQSVLCAISQRLEGGGNKNQGGDERFGDLTGGKSSHNCALYRKVTSSQARDDRAQS